MDDGWRDDGDVRWMVEVVEKEIDRIHGRREDNCCERRDEFFRSSMIDGLDNDTKDDPQPGKTRILVHAFN